MAQFPGTEPVFTPIVDDPGGDPYSGSQVNVCYTEITASGAHFGGGLPITAAGGIRLTLKNLGLSPATVVGYVGQAAIKSLAGTPVTLIPAGTYDCTSILAVTGVIKPSSGSPSAGFFYVENDSSYNLYEVGSDIVTIAVAAGGAVTVSRGGGTKTYDILFMAMGWI